MKKILSLLALVAMLCVPFCLVSCGDDDDPTPTPGTQSGTYTISITNIVGGDDSIDKVIEFIKAKVGNDATIQTAGQYAYKMQVKDKAKADAVIKGLDLYKTELDKLLKANTKLVNFSFDISDGVTTLYRYEYENEDIDTRNLITYGVYSYTDKDGLVWTFTYTDEDAGDGTTVGSLVVPMDVENVKAGTYEGKCKIYSYNVEFRSNQMQGKVPVDMPAVYARFGLMSDAGTPALVKICNTLIFSAEFFQKIK